MKQNRIYLDSYILQQDMRIRMPKAILTNMEVIKGKTVFDIFFDPDESSIILKSKEKGKEIINE